MKTMNIILSALFILLLAGMASATAQTYWTDENNGVWIKTNLTNNSITTFTVTKTAGYAPDGNRVFDFFDNFSSNTLNTTKWTTYGSGSTSISGGVCTVTANAANWHDGLWSRTSFGNFILESNINEPDSSANYAMLFRGGGTTFTNGYFLHMQNSYNCLYKQGSGSTYTQLGTQTTSTAGYHVERIVCNGSNLSWYKDGTYKWSVSDATTASGYIGVTNWGATTQFKNMRARQLASTEPTVTVINNGGGVYTVTITNSLSTNLTNYQVNLTNVGATSMTDSLDIEQTTSYSPVNSTFNGFTNLMYPFIASVSSGTDNYTWYANGTVSQTNSSVASATYNFNNSTVGTYNLSVFNSIGFMKQWNITLVSALNATSTYWIDGNKDLWVNTSAPASSTKTIYVYKGGTNASNGNGTFDFFDDFAGSAVDTTKWTINGGGAGAPVSGGYVTFNQAETYTQNMISKASLNNSTEMFTFRGHLNAAQNQRMYSGLLDTIGNADGNGYPCIYSNGVNKLYSYYSLDNVSCAIPAIGTDFDVNFTEQTSGHITTSSQGVTSTAAATHYNNGTHIFFGGAYIGYSVDYIYARQNITTEPTVAVRDAGGYYVVNITNTMSTDITSASVKISGSQLGIASQTDNYTVGAYSSSPVASFTSNVTAGVYPLPVQFNDTSSNVPTSWTWNYGDGSANDTIQNPTHTFIGAGIFTVTEGATNAIGTTYTTKTINVSQFYSNQYPAFAYVANYGNTSVAVVNLSNNTIQQFITVGSLPYSVAVLPNGTKAYVSNAGGTTVSVINTVTNTATSTVTVGSAPQEIVTSPDGKKVYVAVFTPNTVSVINTSTNTVSSTITGFNGPDGIAISPDGSRLYVTDYNIHLVSVVNTSNNTVYATINVGNNPENPAISPDGTRLYVPNNGGNSVSVIDTSNNNVIATVPVGTSPSQTTVSLDGTKVYVGNSGGAFLSVIYTSNNTIATNASISNSRSITVSSDGKTLYATLNNNHISVIDASNYNVKATIINFNNPYSYGSIICPVPLPLANFTTNSTLSTASNNPIQFNDTSLYEKSFGDAYNWSFGDGNYSSLQNPVYAYSTGGQYNVILNVSSPTGYSLLTQLINISNSTSGSASFTSNITSGTYPLTVQFNDTTTGSPTNYAWNYGDGSANDTTANTTHTFIGVGAFTVIEGVTNSQGTTYAQQVITVSQATPTLSWSPSPASFTYGNGLTLGQLNAGSTVDGTFNYVYGGNPVVVGSLIQAGSDLVTATFTPTDTANYTSSNTTTATFTVSKASPTLSYTPSPTTITYGTGLVSGQLNAGSDVGGSFVYTFSGNPIVAGNIISAGSDTITATFTPSDATNYTSGGTTTAAITVSKISPVLTWATPAAITYGTALSATQLSATCPQTGSFVYSPVSGTILGVGTQTLSTTFTPSGAAATNYTTNTTSVSLTVNQATPSITWTTPSVITYGTALSSTQLNAASTVAGTMVYSPVSGTVLAAGNQTLNVTLTPTDTTNYTIATASVTLVINKTVSVISWDTPATIDYPTVLSSTQLNATCNAPGTLVYTPPAGTLLGVGTHNLSVTFTPSDLTNYTVATDQVAQIVINQNKTKLTWIPPADIVYGTSLSATQLNASSGDIPGTFTYVPASGTILSAGTRTLNATFAPTDSLNYSGNSINVTLNVTQTIPTITWSTPANITYGTGLSATQLSATSPQTGSFAYSPTTGTILGVGTHTLNTTFTPSGASAVNYTTNTASVNLTVTQATPSIAWSNPAAITYGTPLSSTQLAATCVAAGTYTYTPASGYIMQAGAGQTLHVDFAPTDTVNYTVASKDVTITVNKGTTSFTANVSTVTIPAGVQFTDTSTGAPTHWSWDFGDGTTDNIQNPIHYFTTAGHHSVTLNFSDFTNYTYESGSTDIFVFNAIPAANITMNGKQGPINTSAPLIAHFNDSSAGINITQWAWDFNDTLGGLPTATTPSATHVFPLAGNYTVTLSVTNDGGTNTTEMPITVVGGGTGEPQKPIAGFSANASTGYIPLTVQFTNVSAFSPSSWRWDFGDNTNSTEQNPIHTYPDRGVYNVTFTATNDYGSDTAQCINFIHTYYAPPATNFITNVTNGDTPLNVQFTDTSTGIISAYNWSFGDGTYSTEQNPIHAYMQVGLYNVSLNASNIDNNYTVTRVNYIVVGVPIPAPVADFNANVTSGAAPTTVQFVDNSTGPVSNYTWDFGDGIGSYVQNPVHVYTSTGTYTVSLNVSNVKGFNVTTKTNYIIIGQSVPIPVADFHAVTTSGGVPFSAQFMDDSTGIVQNRLWDFGDGNTAVTQNPTHVYTQPGVYTVSLNVSNNNGFNISIKPNYINATSQIAAPVSIFHASTTSGTASFTAQFIDDSTGVVTGHSWDFGDGGTSTLVNPTHTYSQVGNYTVTLNVSNNYGFNISTQVDYINVTAPVVVPIPTATFHAVVTNGVLPFNVQFIDDSTGVVDNRDWDFGDGSTAHSQNPVHIYTQAGTYTVTLNASNFNGFNISTMTNYIVVSDVEAAPISVFHANMTGGLTPLTVQFVDDSEGNVSSRVWNFGDGNGSSTVNPIHTYSTVGVYTVSLNVSNAGGSNESMKVGYINATNIVIPHPPLASFRENITGGIAPVTVQFKDTSSNTPTYWLWNFGDSVGTNEQNPDHTYTVPGIYNVTLEIGNADGNDTISELVNVLKPIGIPVANFTSDVTMGAMPLTVHFIDLSSNDTANWLWDFGDNNTSTVESPTYVYQQAGNYTVNLTVNNSAGSNTTTKINYIVVGSQIRANFTANNTNGTVPLFVQFIDASTGSPQNFSWNFGDNATSAEQNPIHEYNVSGNYTVSETVGLGNANDTMTKMDYITAQLPAAAPPIAQFYVNETNISIPDGVDTNTSVKFTDTSIGVGINTWMWVFGDGNTSNEQNPTHIYQKPGTYNVVLTATSPYGTSVSAPTTLNIIQGAPNVTIMVNVSEGYAPLVVQFADSTSNYTGDSYWDFGDGDVSNESNPVHTYLSDGIFTATLTVNRNGQNYTASQIVDVHYVTVATIRLNASQQDQLSEMNTTAGKSLRLEQTSKQAAMYGAIHAVEKGTSGGFGLLVIAILILAAIGIWFFM